MLSWDNNWDIDQNNISHLFLKEDADTGLSSLEGEHRIEACIMVIIHSSNFTNPSFGEVRAVMSLSCR
jgi:hypothetical protein